MRRLMGNFPQALTHITLVNTARLLSMPAHSLSQPGLHGDRPATVRGDEHPAQTTLGAGPECHRLPREVRSQTLSLHPPYSER
jgi:hypothetical protein